MCSLKAKVDTLDVFTLDVFTGCVTLVGKELIISYIVFILFCIGVMLVNFIFSNFYKFHILRNDAQYISN